MIVGLLVSLFAVLLALFDKNLQKPSKFRGLECAVIILFVYLAIRYDYGNDYMSYLMEYQRYNQSGFSIFDIENLATLQSREEYGWIIFNMICKPIGFFGMIMLLAAIYLGQLYYFVKKYVPPRWYWLSVFLFAFHPTLMVVGVAGMLRQWMAISIFIQACYFIRKRKIIPYLIFILLAATIHKTALVLIPVYFLGWINPTKFDGGKVALTTIFFLFYFLLPADVMYQMITPLLSNDSFDVYSDYISHNNGMVGFGISTIIVAGLPILCLSQIRELSTSIQCYVILMMLQLIFLPMVPINHMVARFQVYFFVFSIFIYPNVFSALVDKGYKSYVVPLLILICTYYLYLFVNHFIDPVWFETTYNYHTIFEQKWQ